MMVRGDELLHDRTARMPLLLRTPQLGAVCAMNSSLVRTMHAHAACILQVCVLVCECVLTCTCLCVGVFQEGGGEGVHMCVFECVT
jgi:hypothetical protein